MNISDFFSDASFRCDVIIFIENYMQFEVLWRSWSGVSVESTSANSVWVALNTNTQLFFCSYIKSVMYSLLFSLSWFPCKSWTKCGLLPIFPIWNERSATSQLHTLCQRNTCLVEDLFSFPGMLNSFQDLSRLCVELTVRYWWCGVGKHTWLCLPKVSGVHRLIRLICKYWKYWLKQF